jgi:hypothetical protein
MRTARYMYMPLFGQFLPGLRKEALREFGLYSHQYLMGRRRVKVSYWRLSASCGGMRKERCVKEEISGVSQGILRR